MFPKNYYAKTYYAPRYFMPIVGAIIVDAWRDIINFSLTIAKKKEFTLER